MVQPSFPDLTAQADGTPWGITRSWTNGASYSTGLVGTGMVVTELPHLRQDAGGTLDSIAEATPEKVGRCTSRRPGR
jgi:hypothetical protein